MRLPAQVLSGLLDALATLLTAMVNLANQAQHNAEIAKLQVEIAQAKEELNTENARMPQSGLPRMLRHNEFR